MVRRVLLLGLYAAVTSSCGHRGAPTEAAKPDASQATPVPLDSWAPPAESASTSDAEDAGLGCQFAIANPPRESHKKWRVTFEVHGPSWRVRDFSLDVENLGVYGGNLEERRLLGANLPPKECTRTLSEATRAAFEATVRETAICTLPLHSSTPPPREGPREGAWSLLLCTDFGEQCTIQRRADEWTHDAKLKGLLHALEALVRATCQ